MRCTLLIKIYSVLCILLFLYNEYIIYAWYSWFWAELKCQNETECLRILLVADPQLIGEENEVVHFLTPFSIWDSDRYLQKTYNHIINHMEPNVIIFLGDLFDEGSTAKTAQYFRYLKRFFTIFSTGYPIKHIWLPGDNDIGGETDMVTEYKVKRFENAFSQPQIIDIKNIRFSKINRMLPTPLESFTNMNKNPKQISVIVSHMPLIFVPATYVDQVLEVLKPKLIFAAHEHESKIIETNREQQNVKIKDFYRYDNKIVEYKLDSNNKQIIEILVPPASYRMGTRRVGYGGAIIENDTLQYTVFWSPDRFLHLSFYLLLVLIFTIHIMLKSILKRCSVSNKIQYSRMIRSRV